MPVRLAYITAGGDEIILDDDEHTFTREVIGRGGFESPTVRAQTTSYGDGTIQVAAVKKDPRTVTCYFWVDTDKPNFERRLEDLKRRLTQTGRRNDGNWGRLKIRRGDGVYLYLSCVYTGGFDTIVRDAVCRLKFTLTFQATDTLFYEKDETVTALNSDRQAGALYLSPETYFRGVGSEIYLFAPNQRVEYDIYLECSDIYPTIEIYGMCSDVKITNAATGKVIHFDRDLMIASGERVEVVTAPLKRSARLIQGGKERSVLSRLSADSTLDFPLLPGMNRVSFTYSDGTPECFAVLKYVKGYESVW